MDKRTRKHLEHLVEYAQSQGLDIMMDHMMTGYRITNKTESRDISPRLPLKEMTYWLEGFMACHFEETNKAQLKRIEETKNA